MIKTTRDECDNRVEEDRAKCLRRVGDFKEVTINNAPPCASSRRERPQD